MSSPITFSGFNNIDFTTVVNALMAQASIPLTNLQTQQSNVKSQVTNFETLDSRLSTLQTAAAALGSPSSLATNTATSSDTTAVAASVASGATAGHYDVVVQTLAKAQVTASASVAPDASTTTVADGGSLTINGTAVTLSGAVTMQGLADAINNTAGVGVTASVVQTDTSAYRLVLTSSATGTANAFTVTNALTGGIGVAFTDTNADGVSGDSAADNAVQAADASALVNNVQITSSSNTLSSVIPGATLTLLKQDPAATIGVDVAPDDSALQDKLTSFINAYNGLQTFLTTQATSAASGDRTSIARDPLVRQLSSQLRQTINSAYTTGSSFSYLAQIGVEFTQSGTMQLNTASFSDAVANGAADASKLLAGTSSVDGAFTTINTFLTEYTQNSGLISTAQQLLNDQAGSLGQQIVDMQARLAIQRTTLQQQFTAADLAMTQLQSQTGALASFANTFTSSSSSSSSGG